jgi:hypothetical protein
VPAIGVSNTDQMRSTVGRAWTAGRMPVVML